MVSMLTAAVGVALTANVSAQETASADDVEKIEVVKHRQPYRGDVPLKSLPQSVDVVSGSLLQDTGINDLQNALMKTYLQVIWLMDLVRDVVTVVVVIPQMWILLKY